VNKLVNHLKTWKKKYARINCLRNLSAALWDEDKLIVSFHHEHYTNRMEVKIVAALCSLHVLYAAPYLSHVLCAILYIINI
jgi:hypothetical protein